MINKLRNGFAFTGRALGFLSLETRGMHAAAYVLGASALFSSLLALLRDRLLAHTFGAGLELDLYYAAFRIPDLLFVAVGSLVSAYVLIPALAAREKSERSGYIDTIVVGFSVCMVVAGLLAYALAPFFLVRLFPNFATAGAQLALLDMTRILLLQPVFLGLSNIVGAITQFRHRFTLYALTPIVYNAGIIIGIVALYPLLGLRGIVWGVVIGAALHLIVQMPSAMADGFFRKVPRAIEWRAFTDTVRVSLPRALALSMGQIAFLVLLVIAGSLSAGSIAIFVFAFNLQAVPLGIIGASYSVAAFPTLAVLWKTDAAKFAAHVALAARHVLFWSLPAIGLMLILRAHIVRAVLGSGAFDWADTRLTAAAFALFGISLASQGIMLLLIRAYYAAGKTLTPFLVSAGSAAAAALFSLLCLQIFGHDTAAVFFESLLRVEGVRGVEVLALPLAYSLASLLATLALALHFGWQYRSFFSSIGDVLWEGLTATFFGAFAAYGTLIVLGAVTLSSTLAEVLARGTIAGIVGLAASALTYYCLGSKEYVEAVRALKRRVWREAEPVSSAEEGGASHQ